MLNGLNTIFKNDWFINKRDIFSYLAIFIYWLSNLVKKYTAVARRLESSLYIH